MKSLEDRLFDKYGARLSLKALSEVLGPEEQTIRKEICANKFPIKTFKLKPGRSAPRYADYRDVARHLNDTSAFVEPASPGRDGYTASKSANPSSR